MIIFAPRMENVTYLSNIEVPYRAEFFSRLASRLPLTVVYERRRSANRDSKWASSGRSDYDKKFLGGINLGSERSFSFSIFRYIFRRKGITIVGCYNSPVQMMAILAMKSAKIPYIINLDGEQFIGSGLKSRLKRFFLGGAAGYLVAGDNSRESIVNAISPISPVFSYRFSSLTREELERNAQVDLPREDFVLVVGQYFPYKGMDVALEVARKMPNIPFKFVGMGVRQQQFIEDCSPIPDNVELIPFLQKDDLYNLYARCKVFMLPSVQECWGLVINEAASFGTPIVSTSGSGAAREFLTGEYARYLATPGDAADLEKKLRECLESDCSDYSEYLKRKSSDYSIEATVDAHVKALQTLSV